MRYFDPDTGDEMSRDDFAREIAGVDPHDGPVYDPPRTGDTTRWTAHPVWAPKTNADHQYDDLRAAERDEENRS